MVTEEGGRCEYIEVIDDINYDLPFHYRHIRAGLRSVRPEYYQVMHILKAKYHMSENQAQGAIVTVANVLFNRKTFGKWKFFEKKKPTDCNTLPASQNTIRTEPYIEAMILSGIVEEIMSGGSECVIVYSNDGSALSGTGSFVVQSFLVNGVKRALPTLGIFTESKKTLTELEITTLEILSASVGRKYSEKEILEKVDFVMTDSTAHNIGVIEEVCEKLECESVPASLICNVHPLMMFQRKVKDFYQAIHDSIGNNKIKDCFLVDIDFRNESFIYKAIQCLTSFINRDFSAKPWNRQKTV